MDAIVSFGKFWYDFVIGDDWLIAALVGVTLVVLALVHRGGLWWILPLVVAASLGASLWRATH